MQDPSNTSEIGFESDTAQQMEKDRKSAIEAVVEEPAVQEPDQFGIIAPVDSSVQMEIKTPDAEGSDEQIDTGMEMPEMEDEEQDPAFPDSSAMEEF
jgi:hypothetical protein